LRLARLDVKIAYVHGVGVTVHNHGLFIRVTADVKYDFHYVGHDWKNHRQRLPQGSPQCASQFDIHTPV